MTLPKPVPGLVLRYSYLWHSESREGREEGVKDRPCAVVASILSNAGETRVLVLPITHTQPVGTEMGVEIPPNVKNRLGLDETRSWIVLSEWNEFVWPGPDLRRVSNLPDSPVAYGMLPPRFFIAVRDRFLKVVRQRKARPVSRT